MDKYELFREELNLIIAALVAGIVSWITLFFKKVPSLVKFKVRKKVIIYDWAKASKINEIIQDNVDEIGAIYGHIISYHNHGPLKMTVLYEATGHPCSTCISKCSYDKEIRRLQSEWIDRPILPFWLNNMALNTLSMNGTVNTKYFNDLDETHQHIWNDANIHTFREVLIKVRSDGFLTFGLSFCDRFQNMNNVDAKMMSIANKLQNLT